MKVFYAWSCIHFYVVVSGRPYGFGYKNDFITEVETDMLPLRLLPLATHISIIFLGKEIIYTAGQGGTDASRGTGPTLTGLPLRHLWISEGTS